VDGLDKNPCEVVETGQSGRLEGTRRGNEEEG